MSITTRAAKRALGPVAITVVAVLITACQPDLASYELVTRTFSVRPYQAGGGHISCPPGKRVLAGGAFFHRPGQPPDDPFVTNAEVIGSSANYEGTAYFGLGANYEPGRVNEFTVVAQCVPASQVSATKLVRHDFELNEHTPTPPGGYVSCPDGHRVSTGGAFNHRPGELPSAGFGPVFNSTSTVDGKGWYADGRRSLNEVPKTLTVVAHCLPAAQLQRTKLVTVDLDVTSSDAVGSYVSCPPGHRVLTGGAFWHRVGEPLDPERSPGRVVSSSVTFDGRGWFAAGSGRDARLTIVARCLPV